jgi:hypothetical protein
MMAMMQVYFGNSGPLSSELFLQAEMADLFPDFSLSKRLRMGAGGMDEVDLAQDRSELAVALKIVPRKLLNSKQSYDGDEN